MAYSESDPWVGHRNLAISASEVRSTNEELKKLGARVHYEPVKGTNYAVPVAHSNAGRNDFLRATGSVDHDGGYGEYTGK